MKKNDVAIIIPARIGSTRLPRKMLRMIGGKTLIEHVVTRVSDANAGDIFVATDSMEIAKVVESSGNVAIITDEACLSGSDRVYQALTKMNNNAGYKFIINVQGDMPFIDGKIIRDLVAKLQDNDVDITTSYVKIDKEAAMLPENVKIVKDNSDKALYFSRAPIPYGADEYLYHVGVYGFTVEALNRFVNLSKGKYEQQESLEQLRALENGMVIGLVESSQVPISIDTEQDLDKANKYFEKML